MKAIGLILAGGASKRFGGDKPLALVDGEPMIKKVAKAMYEAVGEVYLSVNTAERGRQLFNVAKPYVSGYIVDEFKAGPLSGMLTAARQITSDFFITVSADVPFIKSTSIKSLLDFLTDSNSDAASIVWANGCVETLIQAVSRKSILNYGQKFLDWRMDFLRPSDILRSANKLLLVHASAITQDPIEFANINTAEDLVNPKPRGPLKDHVKNSILITDCAEHFAKAVSEYSNGSYFKAGTCYSIEAITYLRHSITHIALHAFYDSAAAFKKAGAEQTSTLVMRLASQTAKWMRGMAVL